MSYAIVINLDYENHQHERCAKIWRIIEQEMVDAGFRRDGRALTTQLDDNEASELARRIIDALSANPEFSDCDVFDYIKEFYGYNTEGVTNLLLPPTTGIVVEEGS